MTHEEHENVFDDIISQVGNAGKFQKCYDIIYNLVFIIIATSACFGIILSLAVPKHWCNVPGIELTNYTIEEWKNLTIPWDDTNNDYSKCTMFHPNNTENFTECLYGWQYDTTYYGKTIATQENWVCQKEMYATNFLVFSKIGEITGSFLIQLGDIYGRKFIFISSVAFLFVGRLGLLFATNSYYLFIAFAVIGNISSFALFQAPLIISLEISSIEGRSFVTLLQNVGWSIGSCVMALSAWILRDWIIFTLVSTLPLFLFMLIWPFMIESPRWLANKKRTKECVTELKKIAKINKTAVTDKIIESLNENQNEESKEKNYSLISLFATWKLAKKTILVIIGWVSFMLIYTILILNVTNLKGNPFVNYFWQGLAECPGYLLGKYFSDALGRKWTKTITFFLTTILFLVLVFQMLTAQHEIIILVCMIAIKIVISVMFFAINLQTLEIYPTCLRQTGASVGFLVAGIFGIIAPYIIYLGISINPSVPYVVSAILSIVGGVSGFFLPETLHQQLPETVADAENFGDDQKLFSFPHKTKLQAVPTNEKL